MAGVLDSQNQQGLVAQIIAQAPTPEIALAMLMGSLGESTQNPLDSGSGGYGAFGFTPPSSWGLNMTTVWNPADAVAAILPAYEAAYYGKGSGNGAAEALGREQQAGVTGGASGLTGATPAGAAELMNIAAEGPKNDIAEMQAIMGQQNGFNRPGGMATYGAATSENVNQNYNIAMQELQKAGNQVGPQAAQTYVQNSGGSAPGAPTQNSPILNEPSGPGTTGSSAAGSPTIGSAQSNPAKAAPPTYLPGSNIDVTGTAANDAPQTPNNTPWPKIQKYIEKNYPSFAWALNEPGLKEVLDQAVRGQYSQTQVQAMVAQTQWWKTTSDSIRQWQELQHTDPGQVQTRISQAIRQVQSQAASLGAQLSQQDLTRIGTQVAEFGWSSGQSQAAINTAMGKGGQTLSPQYLGYLQGNGQQLNFTNEGGKIGQTTAADKAYHTAVQQLAAAGVGNVPEDVIKSLAMQSIQAGPNFDWQSEIDQLAGKVGSNKYAPGYLQQVLTNPTEFSFSTGKNPAEGSTLADQALSYIKQAAGAVPLQLSTKEMETLASHALQEGWIQVNGNGTVSVQGNQLSQELATMAKKAGVPNVSASYTQQILQNPQEENFSKGKTPWTGATTADAALASLRSAAVQAGMNLPLSRLEELTRQGERAGWFTNPDGSQQLGQALASAAQELGQPYVSPTYLTALISNPQSVGLTGAGAQGTTMADKALNSALNLARSQGLQLPQSVLESLVQSGLPQGWFDANGNPVGDALSNAIGNHASQGKSFNPSYLTGMASDPSNYQFGGKNPANLANQTAMHIEVLAGTKGINLNQAQVQELATRAMQHNISDEQLLQEAAKMISYEQPQAPGQGVPGNELPPTEAGAKPGQPVTNDSALALQIQQQAASYLQSLAPAALQQWMQGIAGGTQTTQQLQAYLAQQAEEKYPGMAQLLKQGLTPQQITNSLTNQTAQLLGVDPTQINYINNPQYAKMLNGGYNVGPDGTQEPNSQMMTLQQADTYVKGLPQYQYTADAKSNAADTVTKILEAFGRVG